MFMCYSINLMVCSYTFGHIVYILNSNNGLAFELDLFFENLALALDFRRAPYLRLCYYLTIILRCSFQKVRKRKKSEYREQSQ